MTGRSRGMIINLLFPALDCKEASYYKNQSDRTLAVEGTP